jgi:hypothetical protein
MHNHGVHARILLMCMVPSRGNAASRRESAVAAALGIHVPLLAQIMSVVDDALTTARPCKSARTPARAFDELVMESQRGGRDAALVAELIARQGAVPSMPGQA